MPEAATALSSEAGFFGKRVESRSSKKRDRLGKLRAWWRDYQDSRRNFQPG